MTQEQVIASRELFLASFAQARSTASLSRSMPQIVRAMRDVYREPGEAVFRIGDASESVFFIASGRVELVRGERRLSYGERMVVGTDDVLLERKRTRDAIALTHAHLLELPETTWLEILEDNVEAARGALAGMSGALDALELQREGAEPGLA
ncbi:MAG TPA: cyclic nucleotide-binding domain-containing protein, partial [Polyangiaceae bacterium]